MVSNKKKDGLLTKIARHIHNFKEWIKTNIRKFMLVCVIIYNIIMIMIIPNPPYHIGFIIIFTIMLYILCSWLIPMRGIIKVDFETNECLLMKISEARLHDYEIVDSEGKPSTYCYWLCAGKDIILVVDEITNNKIVLNPVCSQLAFAKHFKNALVEMRKNWQRDLNDKEDLKVNMYRYAFEIAGHLNDENPFNRIFASRRPIKKDDLIDINSIKEPSGNVGVIGDTNKSS